VKHNEWFLTSEVADLLGVSMALLHQLISRRQLRRPGRDRSGTYRWTSQEVEEARHVLAMPRQRPRLSPAQAG
jgi:predicted DNA-binding transcriptional regulator AlpA